MEIVMDNQDRKYKKAKKRVKEIKDFYIHLTVYVVVNLTLIIINLGIFQSGFAGIEIPKWPMLSTPFFWGIGLLFHGLHVFKNSFSFFKDWENRKIKEYMEKEEEDLKQNKF